MDVKRIRASLNLYAVLQNLEDLVRLDPEMARLTADWQVAIQFSVRQGPACYVEFRNGQCRHGIGRHPRPEIKLYFLSCKQLNQMFDGKANPIPLKGFRKIGFLKKDFARLTDRLVHYLKPEKDTNVEPFVRISTTFTMNTVLFGASVLAACEPTAQRIANHIPDGILQMKILPNGPVAHIAFRRGRATAQKTAVETPDAVMAFRDFFTAQAILNGKLDAFLAVAEERLFLRGQLPLIDGAGLILDRVGRYIVA